MAEALKVLREGGIILYPTDTIWGIGCDATSPEAVSKIYQIKKRDDSKALVLLASDIDMVCKYIKEMPYAAQQLIEVNDRPMTIIYPEAICGKKPQEGKEATSGKYQIAWNAVAEDGSVGIRIPMMEFCRNLSFKLGRPIVSTSANISGEPSPKSFADIPQEIVDAADYVVDPHLERESTGLPSQIIKVGSKDEITIIRG